jgi:hypothetical protein
MRRISRAELSNHRGDCWIAIRGVVYDVSHFSHPGGPNPIRNCAGTDATAVFDSIHSPDALDQISDMVVGSYNSPDLQPSPPDLQPSRPPPIAAVFNLYDMETVAKRRLSPLAWAYYSSGADDEITLRENQAAFLKILFKPRILRNVKNIDLVSFFYSYDRLPPCLAIKFLYQSTSPPPLLVNLAILLVLFYSPSYILRRGCPHKSCWISKNHPDDPHSCLLLSKGTH